MSWHSHPKKKRKRSISEESDIDAEEEEDAESDMSSEPEVDMTDPVLVTYKTKKATKNYVGKVEEVKDGQYCMMYLQMQAQSNRKFVFPSIADCDTIDNDQILLKFKPPTIRRGILEFQTTFSGMFVQ